MDLFERLNWKQVKRFFRERFTKNSPEKDRITIYDHPLFFIEED